MWKLETAPAQNPALVAPKAPPPFTFKIQPQGDQPPLGTAKPTAPNPGPGTPKPTELGKPESRFIPPAGLRQLLESKDPETRKLAAQLMARLEQTQALGAMDELMLKLRTKAEEKKPQRIPAAQVEPPVKPSREKANPAASADKAAALEKELQRLSKELRELEEKLERKK
jgi:hypothetical protein